VNDLVHRSYWSSSHSCTQKLEYYNISLLDYPGSCILFEKCRRHARTILMDLLVIPASQVFDRNQPFSRSNPLLLQPTAHLTHWLLLPTAENKFWKRGLFNMMPEAIERPTLPFSAGKKMFGPASPFSSSNVTCALRVDPSMG